MSKNLYVIRKGLLFVILFYFLLPLQSASAALWEYSISGGVDIIEDGRYAYTMDITGTAFINDYKTPNHSPDDSSDGCDTAGTEACSVKFAITYFEMNVGDEYSFTGTSGFFGITPADSFGALYGTGDFSSLRWSDDNGGEGYSGPTYRAENYEEWLAFELPTLMYFFETAEALEVTNPDFPRHGVMGGSLQRVGPEIGSNNWGQSKIN